MDAEQIYSRLPIPIQNQLVGWQGRRLTRLRYDPSFHSLLQEYERRASWGAAELRRYAEDRLARFVRDALMHVPYYQQSAAQVGVEPQEICSTADLKKLPILARPVVQDSVQEISTTPKEAVITSHTSGSTGTGLRFPVTLAAHREQWAVWWRYRRWHGIGLGSLCLYFGGRSVVPLKQRRAPFWRYNRPGSQILFSGYHLGPATAGEYLREMARYPGAWIHGYPSIISLIAGYALELDIKLDVSAVTMGAENLMPQQRQLIAEAFGVRPREHYGMAEGVANFSECPQGNLHVDEDYAFVEFEPIGNGQYKVVGTNFSNSAFPLIRYDTGDVCTLLEGACSCGLPGRLVAAVDGRNEDFVVTKSGAHLGRLDHIFKDCTNIREAQIVQTDQGQMTLRIVKGPNYKGADESVLRDEVSKRVGNDMDFDLDYVDAVERTSTGKVRFVISNVTQDRIIR